MTDVIAHRGASRAERENTIAAFVRARELGADMVELDVRRLADGQLAVHHDAALEPGGKPLARLRASDLPEHVPLLADALQACDGMRVNIEVKNLPGEPGFDEEALVVDDVDRIVRAEGWVDRVLVSSFHLPTVDRAHGFGLGSAWLVVDLPDGTLDLLIEHGHQCLHPWDGSVTAEVVLACQQRAIGINVWTVDDPVRIRELAAWGVDGICTNVPDVAREVLSAGEPA
jgi:glycerophosphoryl diester phosphodiesterase